MSDYRSRLHHRYMQSLTFKPRFKGEPRFKEEPRQNHFAFEYFIQRVYYNIGDKIIKSVTSISKIVTNITRPRQKCSHFEIILQSNQNAITSRALICSSGYEQWIHLMLNYTNTPSNYSKSGNWNSNSEVWEISIQSCLFGLSLQ